MGDTDRTDSVDRACKRFSHRFFVKIMVDPECVDLDGLVRGKVSVHTFSGLIDFVWHTNVNSSFNVRDRGDLQRKIHENCGNSTNFALDHFHYLRVFGRIRFDFACVPPSSICRAVLSFGEIRLNDVDLLVGDVNDSTFSFSMSKRSFSLRRRRSSSAKSRCRLGRHNAAI